MNADLDLPIERYGLIADLANRMNQKELVFGKTALQKFVYFLQELFGIDVGYRFRPYNYGPFDSTLLAELDAVTGLDGVVVETLSMGTRILPGPDVKTLLDEASGFLKKHDKEIQTVVDEFGQCTAKSLELFATIVYVERETQSGGKKPTPDILIKRVSDLKPHFSKDEIKSDMEYLKRKGYILAKNGLPVEGRHEARA